MTKIHILLTFLICGCAPALAQPRAVSVNPSERFQTIDNFTASDAWSGEFVGRYWGEAEKSRIARWLFSRETDEAGNPCGIGLSMWRVNLGGGTLEQENPDIQPSRRPTRPTSVLNATAPLPAISPMSRRIILRTAGRSPT
mgnify:FL=1